MPGWQRAHLAACAGVIAYMLTYVATDYLRLPRFTYDQLGREWRFVEPMAGISSGYVGLWAWALLAGLSATGAVFLGLRWRSTPVSSRALGLWLAWAATATLVAVGYYTWHNWP